MALLGERRVVDVAIAEDVFKEPPAMHVRFGSDGAEWHRLTVDTARRSWEVLHSGNTRTACGKRITGYYATREESYEGRLCQGGCFTAYEFTIAQQIVKAEADRRAAELAAHEEEWAERAREMAEDRSAARRRIDIATGKIPKVEDGDDDR